LRFLDRPAEAIPHLAHAIQREPANAEAHNVLGLVHSDLGALDMAARHFEEALRIDSRHPEALRGHARVLLLAEDFERGWSAWLRSLTPLALAAPENARALFAGKRVVVYGTEGVGDEIMFASCLAPLAVHAKDVSVHCDPRLAPLLRRSFPALRVCAMEKQGARRTIGVLGPDEIHVLASFLPAYFPPSLYPRPSSYLIADATKVDQWRARFDELGAGIRVGIAWRGGIDPLNRSRRSIPLTEWTRVLRAKTVKFVNLQYGDVDREIAEARNRTGAAILDFTDADQLADLDGFAAQIRMLDLVLSVDNTTVHMAGALGVPVVALLPLVPDWRWKMRGTTSDWYPSVRLIRQDRRGYWATAMREASRVMEEYASADSKTASPH
jgi:ADP-heptose:LPS heptosyltransferase